MRRRWPCVDVLVVPVRVQGELAPGEIVAALDTLSRAKGIDVIVLGRGGGSLEDLWAFNEEAVAHAIHRCPIPLVSAVGHETDVTIADFVADARAATPTAAAEMVVPARADVMDALDALGGRAVRHMRALIDLRGHRLREMLRSYALGQVRGRIERSLQQLDYARERLRRALLDTMRERGQALALLGEKLEALGPRSIIARGYALCTDAGTGRLLRSAGEARESGDLDLTFQDGTVRAEVKETA
jgi:exodeoxyribonuclease VII large subunit